MTQDPRLTAELRFGLREFEPGAVLIEQLSILAAAPVAGSPASKRFSRRAAAGLFAGLLLASGTAYAARDQIVPALNSIIGHSQHQAPVAPRPVPSPGTPGSGANASGGPAPSVGSQGSEDSQDQQGGRRDATQGQQAETGPDAGDAQQSPPAGTSTDPGQTSSGGTENAPGGGASTPGDGSSVGQQ